MAADDRARGLLHLLLPVAELLMRPTPLFGRIGGQLAAVDREVFLADQTQLFAVQQDIAEQCDDLVLERTDEARDGGEMRPRIRRQRHEHHVAPAGLGELPTRDQPLGVAIEHDLEEHLRIIGQPPGLIILIPMLEHRQVEMLFDDLVERMLERPRHDLIGIGNREKLVLLQVVRFVPRHPPSTSSQPCEHLPDVAGCYSIGSGGFFYTLNAGAEPRRVSASAPAVCSACQLP